MFFSFSRTAWRTKSDRSMPWSAAILSIASAICFSSRKATNLSRFTVVNPVKHILATFRMGKMGTKSMKQLDLAQIPFAPAEIAESWYTHTLIILFIEPFQIRFATPEIAESWTRGFERDALKRGQGQKRPLPMKVLIWMEIYRHGKYGVYWRKLDLFFTKHSLGLALPLLLNKGLIERIEDTAYRGRGRKPTRYFVRHRPFLIGYAKTISLKHDRGDFSKGEKEDFYGTLVIKWREPQTIWTKDSSLDPIFPFRKVCRPMLRKRFIRLTPGEKEKLDAYLVRIAAGKRGLIWASLKKSDAH